MKFSSLEEYFYKLQNILLLLLLTPLLSFMYVFVGPLKNFSFLDSVQPIVMGLLIFMVALDWIFMTLLFKNRVHKISKEVGLSLKLERYYYATLIRYSVGVASSLMLAFGFYLTKNSVFMVLFGIGLALFFVAWPRPAKVCRDLKLKGDEKEMVLYKKHTL